MLFFKEFAFSSPFEVQASPVNLFFPLCLHLLLRRSTMLFSTLIQFLTYFSLSLLNLFAIAFIFLLLQCIWYVFFDYRFFNLLYWVSSIALSSDLFIFFGIYLLWFYFILYDNVIIVFAHCVFDLIKCFLLQMFK